MKKHTFNQILSSFTASLVMLHAGVWRGYLSVIIPRFKAGDAPIPIDLDTISWMVSLVDVGSLLSPFPAGYLMNRFGRLAVLRLAFLFFLVAVPLILGATTPYHLHLASLLVGLGHGIGYSTPTLYIAEIAKPKIRGTLASIIGLMLSGGTALTMTVGPFVSTESLTGATVLCPLAGLLLTLCMVESPYYYLIRNNEVYASKALSRVRNGGKANEKEIELKSMRKRVDDNMNDTSNFWELISQKSNRKATVIVMILATMRVAGGFACMSVYAPTSLPKVSFWDPKTSMMIFSWLNVISSILGMSLVDRFGRKPLLMFSLCGCLLVTLVSAVFYFCQQKTGVDVSQFVFVPHVGILLIGVFIPIGVGMVPQIYRGEVLPVTIKGPVSAASSVLAGICGFSYNKVYFAVEQSIGAYFMYVMFSAGNILSILFTLACVFETKGKTLEEIQYMLSK